MKSRIDLVLEQLGISDRYFYPESRDFKKLELMLSEKRVDPLEYFHFVLRNLSPKFLIPKAMITSKVWDDFLSFRDVRMNENKIKATNQIARLYRLLEEDELLLDEMLVSPVETFFVFFKYVIACKFNLEELMPVFLPGAVFESRIMPELRTYFAKFGPENFPEENYADKI